MALSASPTAYCGAPGKAVTEVNLAGSELGLVALVQMRNNARVAVAGSISMFSNSYFDVAVQRRDGKRSARAWRGL
jgi:oligosaccharyltransferase complex subunit beta